MYVWVRNVHQNIDNVTSRFSGKRTAKWMLTGIISIVKCTLSALICIVLIDIDSWAFYKILLFPIQRLTAQKMKSSIKDFSVNVTRSAVSNFISSVLKWRGMKCFCSCEKRRIITKPPLNEHKYICDALRDLVPFVQFKKTWKKPTEEFYCQWHPSFGVCHVFKLYK